MIKRIAFIRPRTIPISNVVLMKILALNFINTEIDVIDIQSVVKTRPDIIAINTILTFIMYGRDIISGHKKFKAAFWRTPYIFHTIKYLVARRLAGRNYDFTFQTQSLFDCSIPGVPHFIYTDHTHLANLTYPNLDKQRLYPQEWIDLEKQIYRNATLIFVRSSNIKKSLIEQYNQQEETVKCVYAGYNVEASMSAVEDKDYSGQNILFVGFDWERKGGPDLIEAFKLILEKYPSATLTIVGANPKIQVPNTKIIGKVPLKSLKPIYEAATLFCMPTYVEPFGVVFLEAMQAHLPLIGTKVGAIPDFIKDGWNGWLVEPGDVHGIAKALSKLLANPELCRKFGKRNFKLTQERYSWEAVGEKIHATISGIL